MRNEWVMSLALVLGACGSDVRMTVPDEGALLASVADEACGADVDGDSDGHVDSYERYRYENDGLRWVMDNVDLEGAVYFTTIFDFDHGGRIVAVENRSYALDDDFALRDTYVYDSFGRRLRTESDDGIDGTPEVVETVTAWSDAGKPTASSTAALDGDSYTKSWTYDDSGRMTSEVWLNADSSERVRITAVYDDVARTAVRTRQAGTAISIRTKTYDAAGRLVRIAFSYPSGEHEGGVTELVYDGDRLVSQSSTDGVFTSKWTYKYSCGS